MVKNIVNELSKIYIENYLIFEKEKYNRSYNLDEITRIYLSIYRQILKILLDLKIFNVYVNDIAYSVALINLNKNIKDNFYVDINMYVRGFVDSYKYAVKEVNKDYMLKNLFEELNINDLNIRNKGYRK